MELVPLLAQTFSHGVPKAQRVAAEQQLDGHARHNPNDYVAELLRIITSHPDAATQMYACVVLKHFATNLWRQREGTIRLSDAMADAAKTQLTTLVASTAVPRMVLGQVGLCLGRMARHDYPTRWPSLAHDFVQRIAAAGGSGAAAVQLKYCLCDVLDGVRSHCIEGEHHEQLCQSLHPFTVTTTSDMLGTQAADGRRYDADAMKAQFRLLVKVVGYGPACPQQTIVFLLQCAQQLLSMLSPGTPVDGWVPYALCRIMKTVRCAADQYTEEFLQACGLAVLTEQVFPLLLQVAFELPRTHRDACEKAIRYAFQLMKALLDTTMSSPDCAQAVNTFFLAENCARTIRCVDALLSVYLKETADTTGWQSNPEQFVIDKDVADDPSDIVQCAEHLFLSLLESVKANEEDTTVAVLCWNHILPLINSDDPERIETGLRAMGLAWAVLGPLLQDDYLPFLRSKLLPALHEPAVSQPVKRRIVWVIGQWCECVTDLANRSAVQQSLFSLVTSSSTETVVALSALRALGEFVKDNNFTEDELPPASVVHVVQVVNGMLGSLRTSDMVKELVGLVYVLCEKGHGYDSVAPQIMQTLFTLLERIEATFVQQNAAGNDGGETAAAAADDSGWDAEDGGTLGGSMGMTMATIIDTLAALTAVNPDPAMLWQHLFPMALRHADVNGPVAVWTEDHAWDLIVAIARASPSDADATVVSHALQCVLGGIGERDFVALPVALQAVEALLLLIASVARPAMDGIVPGLLKIASVVEDDALEAAAVSMESLLLAQPRLVEHVGQWAIEAVAAADEDSYSWSTSAPHHLLVLSVCATQNARGMSQLLASHADPKQALAMLSTCIDNAMALLDSILEPYRRALVLLALVAMAQMLQAGNAQLGVTDLSVTETVGSIQCMIEGEVADCGQTDPINTFIRTHYGGSDPARTTYHVHRLQNLFKASAVSTVPLSAALAYSFHSRDVS